MSRKTNAAKLEAWAKARKRYGLSDTHVQMARELGLNPNKLGSLANHKQEPWKEPLPDFISRIYLNRYGRERPEVVKPIHAPPRPRGKTRQPREAGRPEPS